DAPLRSRWRAAARGFGRDSLSHRWLDAVGPNRTRALHGRFSRARAAIRQARPGLSRRRSAARFRRRFSSGCAHAPRVGAARRTHVVSGVGSAVERNTMSARATFLAAMLAAVGSLGRAGAGLAARRQSAAPAAPQRVIDVHSSATERIRVQVLNATATRGLGRRAMLYLRDRCFD